jgi:hypothetical protein
MGNYFVVDEKDNKVEGADLLKLEEGQSLVYLSENEIYGEIKVDDNLKIFLNLVNRNIELDCKFCLEKKKYGYRIKVVGEDLIKVETLVRAAENYLSVDFTS